MKASSCRVGIPNGSSLNPIANCLREIGITINTETRQAWQYPDHELVDGLIISRPQHLVAALQQGIIDYLIIGKDMLYENGQAEEFVICAELNMSKAGFTNAPKVILFRRADSPITCVKHICQETVIITELQKVTALYLKERNIQARIIPSSGGTEHAVAIGLGDLGVCIMDTGNSLTANKLIVMDCLMEAPVVVCIRAGNPCEKLARNLGELLQGVLKSHERVLLKMNVSAGEKAKVLAIVPSLKAPTIHKLAQNKGYAVETVVSRKELAWLVIRLKDLGARDFIWHELNGIVP